MILTEKKPLHPSDFFTLSLYSIVKMAGQIKGYVTAEMPKK
jgi:hypothetical protein